MICLKRQAGQNLQIHKVTGSPGTPAESAGQTCFLWLRIVTSLACPQRRPCTGLLSQLLSWAITSLVYVCVFIHYLFIMLNLSHVILMPFPLFLFGSIHTSCLFTHTVNVLSSLAYCTYVLLKVTSQSAWTTLPLATHLISMIFEPIAATTVRPLLQHGLNWAFLSVQISASFFCWIYVLFLDTCFFCVFCYVIKKSTS